MEFSSSIYAVLFLLFSCTYLLFIRSSNPKTGSVKAPPEAGGARLFTGHLHLMDTASTGALPHITLGSLADKYGSIFTIRLGVRRVLVVNTWDIAKEVFTTHDVAVSSRPKLRLDRYMSYDNAMLGYAPYGPYWHKLRKFISMQLLSARRIELQRNIRASELSLIIKELYAQWEEGRDDSGRLLVDMKQWIGNMNLNVVTRMVAGKRYYDGDNAADSQRYRKVIRDYFKLVGMFLPGDALPYLSWRDPSEIVKKVKETTKELDSIVGEWMAEHREKRVSGENKVQDFMDVMLSEFHSANLQGHYDVDTIVKATCQILISGGTDGPMVAQIWSLAVLLNNPRVLKKAQEELDKHVGRGRRVDESDINNLVYLQAIVKESLRLHPAAPLGGMREFSKDCKVGGYHIPKGTWLAVNLWKVQRDPKIWDDPLEFKPERFLDGLKNVDIKGGDYELMPFGGGRRICPGANLGLSMMQLVLANLLQAFDFSTVNDQEVDMTGSAGVTNMKLTPLDVLVAPRLSPSLY
ncbi:hypothetical protein ACS0TY_027857 [Phlomoides rotata]